MHRSRIYSNDLEPVIKIAGQEIAAQPENSSPFAYVRDVTQELGAKIHSYLHTRTELATQLNSEIAILRMIAGRAIENYERVSSHVTALLPSETREKQIFQAHFMLMQALDKVKEFCESASRIHRNVTREAQNEVFMLGALTQTLASLVHNKEISPYAATVLEEQIQPVNGSVNNGLDNNQRVSRVPTFVTTEQIVREMDSTVPYVSEAG